MDNVKTGISKTDVKRPYYDQQMQKELAVIMGKVVYNWCNQSTPLPECIESSEKVLRYHRTFDGYDLAKDLDGEGFDPDSILVQDLDDISFQKADIMRKHIKQWVMDNNIKLLHSIGDMVIYEDHSEGKIAVEIVELNIEQAAYGIWHDRMGHEKGKGWQIVKGEDCTKA